MNIKKMKAFIPTIICGLLILIGWQLGVHQYEGFSAIVFVIAFIIGGFNQAKEGILDTIEHKKLNVELLMILSGIGASIIGYWFEGAVLIFIFSLSGALEEYTTDKSKNEISKLMALQPETALLKLADGGTKEVSVESLNVGDLLLVRPGEKVPIDGVISIGNTTIDEAAISGEPIPLEKTVGDQIYGGTINLSSGVTMAVSHTSDQTLFSNIVRLVEQAQSLPSKTATLISKFENTYVKCVLIFVAFMMFLPHFLLGWDWNETFYRAMVLLIVASPCALVAAVTPATLAAISFGAKNGILFKGGLHLENLYGIKGIAFDKTGTLTQGQPKVTDFLISDGLAKEELIQAIVSIEGQSVHPLAKAIVNHFPVRDLSQEEAVIQDVPGWGVEATYLGSNWKIGKAAWFEEQAVQQFYYDEAEGFSNEGKTMVYIGCDGKIVGILALKDIVREEAKNMIAALNQRRIATIMVTGDHETTAQVIGKELGLKRVIADCLPENKVDAVVALEKEYGQVAMVGDGINDAPALANATVGIAMGQGTDIAMEAADIVLIKSDLAKVVTAYDLSQRLHRVVWQNIIFAIAVIICLITANLFQFVNLPLGVVGHEGSTILVILNGLRLLYIKK
ncbi:heavy metal translocating P-type ATPase [Isobaculum melis]|uniref:Cd2+/Zn2+-exporting ATPase n=1 Tax=Isobaculum melis TaxID=142588 RepID=A0A1H9TDC3_9LACT|nr:heavy metal translocating P-type ATPase [Isobaculum melis]SER95037.1 Cd2+/Zn2+-exporting ATPase [Isobaculum melis]